MKRHFLILTTLILTLTVGHGQTNVYYPFPDSNVVWRTGCSGAPGVGCCSGGSGYYVYNEDKQDSLGGDSIIDSFTYKKLYYRYNRFDNFMGPPICPPGCFSSTSFYSNTSYEGAIRQDTILKKVYIILPDSTHEILFYDFNLNIGDTLLPSAVSLSENNYVSKIDSILVGGQFHKRFWLWFVGTTPPTLSDSGYVSIIEGIGSTYGLFYPLEPSFENTCGLTCVKINSVSVYPSTATTCVSLATNINKKIKNISFQIYPNPFSTQTTIQVDEVLKDATLTIFNLFGQKVKQTKNISGKTITLNRDNLPSGLYFIRLIQSDKTFITERFVITDN